MDSLLALLQEKHSMRHRQEWLDKQRYSNAADADFLLNERTKRLVWVEQWPLDKDSGQPRLNPLGVAVALPEGQWCELADPLNDQLLVWIKERKCHPPFGQAFLDSSRIRFSPNGFFLEHRPSDNGNSVKAYLCVQRNGVVELGMGEIICYATRNGKNQIGIRFVTLTGLFWQFLLFIRDFYRRFDQKKPFTIGLGLRGIKGSVLGQLGHGWREPHEWPETAVVCQDSGLWIQREQLQANMEDQAVDMEVRRVAQLVGYAWGHDTPRCFNADGHQRPREFPLDKYNLY
jgi:hypothetical protein